MSKSNFIKAAFGRSHDRIPVWIMRQAGRYLPQYHEVKKKHSFNEICRTPELMSTVTLQPIQEFGMDAAIVFSDILLPLEPMGLKVEFPDSGPKLNPTVETPEDVDRLMKYKPAEALQFVLDGIKYIRGQLNGTTPVIGFCGSPFTLAYYATEGKSSMTDSKIKTFMYKYPEAAGKLLDLLAELTGLYLKEQIKAGAQAVQLFDSRGGILSPEDYERYSLPYIKKVFDICKTEGVPRILFLNNTTPYLNMLNDLDCEVISIDWRTDIRQAMSVLKDKTIQGNLDPYRLYAEPEALRSEILGMLKRVPDYDRFIFNLGHGITPKTPVENVRLLVDTVHDFKINDDQENFRVSRKLLTKYDRPGPRYTSYPTAPEWREDYGFSEYQKALQKASEKDEPLSLYVHIPFCESRCYYCGCNTFVNRDRSRVDQYLVQVEKELRLVSANLGNRNRLNQLHWGGGTPTHLRGDQLKRLFNAITYYFEVAPDAEIAIEIDPRKTSFHQLGLLRNLGFNRVSLGVQDLTPQVQAAIGRNQTEEQTVQMYDKCRELGFGGINVDLIYGLPFQKVDNFQRTISRVIEIGADRIALYSFAYLPRLKSHQRAIDETALPQTEEKYDLFAMAVEEFIQAGYVQIGMDHFARPDDELAIAMNEGRLHRNFMGYTPRKTRDMLGLGMSAIGEISDNFVQNYSDIENYTRAIDQNKLATYRGCKLSEDDKIRRSVILSLMCNFKLSFSDLDKTYGVDYHEYFRQEDSELKDFIDDGLIEKDDTQIRVLPAGRIFVRNIAMVFDSYLRNKQSQQKVQFSRTI